MKQSSFFEKWFESRPLAKRISDVQTAMKKYSDRIPIVVGPASDSAPAITAHKFLTPKDITIGEFMHALRLRIAIKPDQALFMYTHPDDCLITGSSLLQDVFHRHRYEDGFLYLKYDIESTFGAIN